MPVRVVNLIAAGKNIGTTHITNGCYRLHPVEWNIGEAAGALAAFALQHRLTPAAVRAQQLAPFQQSLLDEGVPLAWPEPATMSTTAPFAVEHHHARVGELSLHYVTAGAGEPVVLVHGWPSTWYEWRQVMPLLAGRYRLIAPDLRGLGDSSRPADGLRQEDDRRRLVAAALRNARPEALASWSATTGAARWRSRSLRRIPRRSAP